jgi:hypothetical protein
MEVSNESSKSNLIARLRKNAIEEETVKRLFGQPASRPTRKHNRIKLEADPDSPQNPSPRPIPIAHRQKRWRNIDA